MAKTTRFLAALFTVIIFATTELFAGVPFSLPHSPSPEPYATFNKPALAIPAQFGTIDSFKTGKGPLLIHLQTAHGDYEAQKNIQAILHYLKENYGIKLILVEGSAFKLEPEILRFFPDQMNLTMKIADALAKKALVKGVELFLLENSDSKAYGIENIKAYRANREAFQAVLSHREKGEAFLGSLDSRIQDLRGLYFNKELNLFFKQWEASQKGHLLPQEGVNLLETEAKRHLEMNLSDPVFQIDWPMLVRFFKLKELEKEMNRETFEKERGLFLGKIHPFIKRGQARSHVPVPFLFEEIEKLLSHSSLSNSLPDPETGMLVETMVKSLPATFDFNAYPHVQRFIGMLMLQSEIKGERLLREMSRLQNRIFEKLARTKEEKQTLELFKRYELLRKLFALELSPEDYKKVLEQTEDLYPETLVRSLLELGKNKRKSRFPQADLAAINVLFIKALEFYRRVNERDSWMIKNIEKRMKLSAADKAVVITGGFHAQPMRRYFESSHYHFASITPKITHAGNGSDRENYIDSILQDRGLTLPKSTLESDFATDGFRDFYGGNEKWLSEKASRIAQPLLAEARYTPLQKKRMTQAIVSSIERAPERSVQVFVSGPRSEIRNAEKKKEQDDLKRLASIADILPYPVFHKDLEGQFTYANKAFAEYVGLPVSEILGKMDFEIEKYPKRLVLKYRQNDQWVAETGKTFTGIEDYILPSGKKISVKVTKAPVRDSNEQIVGIQGIFWDVTEQENARRHLTAEHAVTNILGKSKSLEEASPEILKVIGPNLGVKFGAIWMWDNDIKMLRNLDVWHEDLRYKPFEDITRATTFPPGKGLPGRIVETKKAAWIVDVAQDTNFPRAPFAVQVGLHGAFGFPIIIEDQVVGVVEFFSDQIEDPDQALLDTVADLGIKIGQLIKQAETRESLRRNEKQLRKALDAARMGTWEWDFQANRIAWSGNVQVLLDLSKDSYELSYQAYLELIYPEDRNLAAQTFDRLLKSRQKLYEFEHRIQRPDGGIRWLSGKGEIVRGTNGGPLKMRGVITDITERKQNEFLLQETQKQLNQSEKLASIGQLAAGVAHEINNPLTILIRYLQQLTEQAKIMITTYPFLEVQMQQWISHFERLLSYLYRIAKIVQDLLAFSRPAAGQFALIDVQGPLRVALQHARLLPEFKNSQIEIQEHYAADLPKIYGDGTGLSQVFLNLIVNAIHAMGSEGTLTVEIKKVSGKNGIEVMIQDTGKGIAPEELEKIFDPFYTTKRGEQGILGTGLGLSVSRRIITDHGGDLRPVSELGKGTTFTMVFPSEDIVTQNAMKLQIDLIAKLNHDLNNKLVLLNFLKMIPSPDVPQPASKELDLLNQFIADNPLAIESPSDFSFEKVEFLMTDARKYFRALANHIAKLETLLAPFDPKDQRSQNFLAMVREALQLSRSLLNLGAEKPVYRVLKKKAKIFNLKNELTELTNSLNAFKRFKDFPVEVDLREVPEDMGLAADIDGFRQMMINFFLHDAGVDKKGKRMSVSSEMEDGRMILSFAVNYYDLKQDDLQTVEHYGRWTSKMLAWPEGSPDLVAASEFLRFIGGGLEVLPEENQVVLRVRLPRKMVHEKVAKKIETRMEPESEIEPALEGRENQPASEPPQPEAIFKSAFYAEDETDVRQFVSNYLEMFGVKIRTAKDGQEAVELFGKGEGIELVILDMTMPRMTGAEAARRIHAANPNVPIVLLTGYGTGLKEIEDLLNDKDQIIQAVLNKPIMNFREFLASLNDAVKKKSEQILETTKKPEIDNKKDVVRSEVRNESDKKDEGKSGEKLYQSIVENFSSNLFYFFTKDLEGKFTFVSDSFAKLAGRPAEEIIGKMDFELFPLGLAHKYRINDRWVIKNDKNFEDEEEFETPEGKRVIVKIVKVPIKDKATGDIVGVQGMFWDITKQVIAKQRIAGHLGRALDAAQMGTWEWETKSNAFRWSKNVKSLFNLSRRRVNTFDNFIAFVHPKDRERVEKVLLGVLQGEHDDFKIEYRIVLPNEKERWIAQQGKAMRRKKTEGTVVRVAGTLEDITERKQSQLRQKETEDKLKQAEIQTEQQKALTEMESKLRRVIGAIAHIFNNKLTAVLGYTEMAVTMQLPGLKKELETLQEQLSQFGGHYLLPVSAVDEVIAFLANPLKEAHKMKLLIEDLMIYADIHVAHRQTVELDVRAVLKAAFSEIKKELGIKEMPPLVRIEELYDPSLPKVKADMEWLSKALMKIISNGIEAVQEKGGALTITTRKSALTDHVEIIIEDTGPGIDDESVTKRKIFDPFYTTKFLGRGLGLPVALRLIEKMGGQIQVESALGKGTKFRILLPLNGTEARSEIRAKEESRRNQQIGNSGKGWIKDKFKTLIIVTSVAFAAGGASLGLDLHEKAIHVIELFGERTTAALVHGAIAGLIFYIFRLYRKAQKEIKLRVQLEEDILKSTEVIRESEAIHKTLINTLDERIFYKDYKNKNKEGMTGFFVSVNDGFARDFGRIPQDIIGKTDYDLFSEAKAREFREKDQEVVGKRKTFAWVEENDILIDGKLEKRFLEVTKKPVIDDKTGEVIGVLGTYKDITERKRQEQQLKESRALLQGILDALPFVVLERDVALKPQYANARAAIFFGLDTLADRTQAQGVFAENPEFSKKYQIENERIIKSGEAIEEDEDVVIAGRGKIFHKIKHPLFSPEGEILGLVEIYQDVTEEREMFERLTHAEVLEANDQSAKELAHDVNNLLTGVLANIEEASTLLKKGISAQEEMDQATADLNRVVEVVRELRKQSEAGAKTLTMLKLAPIVTQSVRSAKARFPSIEFKPPASLKNLPYIMGNAQQILRAVSNILWNAAETIEAASQAVEATSEKKGVITVTLDRVHLEQPAGIIHSRESFRPGTYLEVAVHNTGPAISEDVLAKMFNVLQEKTKDDFTTKPLGSGKGLLVVRNAVLQNHEGMIDIKTSKDHGTTFHLYFFAPNGGPKPSKIWIIHDIFKIQQGILNQLKEDGYQALPFNNIQAAIDFAKDSSQLPELIIYKEDEKAKIPATLTILKQEVPGKALREVREVAVPKILYQGGSWPKRPNKHIEEFIAQIKKELASRKKTALALPVAEVRREIEKKKEMPEKTLNILIVDDDDIVASVLFKSSEAFAAKLTRVQNGNEAVHEIEREMYDVVFLDLHFVGGTPEEVIRTIKQKWGMETKIIMSSGSLPDAESPLMDSFDARLAKPFRPADVQSLLGQIQKDLAKDKEEKERSEVRVLKNLPDAVRIVIKQYREYILPLWFEKEYGPEVLAEILRELLGRPVYAEKAGIIPVEPKPLLRTEGRIITTSRIQPWLKQIVEAPSLTHSGRAIFDSAWLDQFLRTPRALYLLLKSFEPFQAVSREPFIAFVGDAFLIKNKIRSALERQNNGLTAEEKIEAQALVKNFDQLVKILLPEQVAEYVQVHENGVAILRANQSLISETSSAAHFILEPNAIAPRDVPVVALTAPALLKAAALIRGVPLSEQLKVLKAHMADIFPGTTEQGNAFVIAFASYLAETLQKNEYIATQA